MHENNSNKHNYLCQLRNVNLILIYAIVHEYS